MSTKIEDCVSTKQTIEQGIETLRELRDKCDHELTWGLISDKQRYRLTSAANAIELAWDCLDGRATFVNGKVTHD